MIHSISDPALYQALRTRDSRFDGYFFVAVTSTKIYCRPICRVKVPRESNCRFFRWPAQAEYHGFRPCLRCRPELAPGSLGQELGPALAHRARLMLEEQTIQPVASIARRLGISDRHLRRLFLEAFGLTPIVYQQTQRLLMAKRLLTDTNWSMSQVALNSGFKSVRRFNDLFSQQYRISPSKWRIELRDDVNQLSNRQNNVDSVKRGIRINDRLLNQAHDAPEFKLLLAYREPFDWDGLIRFFQQRLTTGVDAVVMTALPNETVNSNRASYWRVLEHAGHALLIEACPHIARSVLEVKVTRLSDSVEPLALGLLISDLRRLFDLNSQPEVIAQALEKSLLTKDQLMAVRTNLVPRLPGIIDGFEAAVRAILGQQITVKAATTLAGRFAQRFGKPVSRVPRLLPKDLQNPVLFPQAQQVAMLAVDDIVSCGVIAQRARAIIDLAKQVANGDIDLCARTDHANNPEARAESLFTQLCSIPGIGPWTAQYIIMRALSWPDTFLESDLVVRKVLKKLFDEPQMSLSRVRQVSLQWRPWRSYAVLSLWAQSHA